MLEEHVPEETALRHRIFPLATPGSPYVAKLVGAWAVPGPASEEYSAVLIDGSRVTYRWYRFVDQPSLQQYSLPAQTKAALQAMVEKIHENWSIDQDYLPPLSSGSLVSLDPALILYPPAKYRIGYVPIVVRQETAPPDASLFEQLTVDDVLGRYERTPIENDWHAGEIKSSSEGLVWTNDAGVSWPLAPRLAQGKLLTDEQCPYFHNDLGDAFLLVLDTDPTGAFIAKVAGFQFLGSTYHR